MHIGSNKNEGGRLGDFSARTLSASLREAGIELHRLKTGTPPRLLGRSIDFSVMQEQKGDAVPTLFAFHDTRDPEDLFHVEQSECGMKTFAASTSPLFHVEQTSPSDASLSSIPHSASRMAGMSLRSERGGRTAPRPMIGGNRPAGYGP
jgi:tRNA uridine 5-carboxymethylaminomethyl modification enzyme